MALLLAGSATLILAFAWHWLTVLASFPIGGMEFHFVFQRPGGGDARAAYAAASVYAVGGAALAFFLCTPSRRRAFWAVGAVIALSALFSNTTVVWDPDPLDLLVIPLTAALLSLVAALLWWTRRTLPWRARVLLAGIPGACSLWWMYSFPYGATPSFQRTVLPIVVLYPLAFVIASLKSWPWFPGPSMPGVKTTSSAGVGKVPQNKRMQQTRR